MFRADTERMHANGARIGVSAADLMHAVTEHAVAAVPFPAGHDDVSLLVPEVLSCLNQSMHSTTAQGCAFGTRGGHAVPAAAVSFSASDVLNGEIVQEQGAEING